MENNPNTDPSQAGKTDQQIVNNVPKSGEQAAYKSGMTCVAVLTNLVKG